MMNEIYFAKHISCLIFVQKYDIDRNLFMFFHILVLVYDRTKSSAEVSAEISADISVRFRFGQFKKFRPKHFRKTSKGIKVELTENL